MGLSLLQSETNQITSTFKYEVVQTTGLLTEFRQQRDRKRERERGRRERDRDGQTD